VCFFGKITEFANQFNMGDIVLLKNPKVLKSMEKSVSKSLLIQNEEKVVHIGESEDLKMCKI